MDIKPMGMFEFEMRRSGLKWAAYPVAYVHHDDCDDPECRGARVTRIEPIETAWTRKALERKVAVGLLRVLKDNHDRNASESLGG